MRTQGGCTANHVAEYPALSHSRKARQTAKYQALAVLQAAQKGSVQHDSDLHELG